MPETARNLEWFPGHVDTGISGSQKETPVQTQMLMPAFLPDAETKRKAGQGAGQTVFPMAKSKLALTLE